MKCFLVICAFTIGFAGCQLNDKNDAALSKIKTDTTNFTNIKWIDSLKDIGTVPAGKMAEINFRFLNSGDKPLYVLEAKPGCGCTLAEYPKSAIMPGKEGIIKANYNVHKDGQGDFRKSIQVVTNTKGSATNYIFFYGSITPDSSSAKKAE